MTTFAVTGISSAIGRRIAEVLEARPDVTRVVGVDRIAPRFATRNLEFYRIDVCDSGLKDVLAGCDLVIHIPDVERADVVDATRNVLVAADAAGVDHVVHLSSALAYGAHADNDVPLTEDAPLRPNPGWPASSASAATEEIVEAFRESGGGAGVAVLRAALAVGATANGALMRLFESPALLGVRGHDPPVQVVDERDLASAVVFAAERRLSGAYNVAADGWIPYARVGELSGRRRVEMSQGDARRLLETAYAWGLSDVSPGALALLMHPCVVSAERLREEGFVASRSTTSAILDAVEARRGWIAVGKLRFRPRNAAALAGAAVVGASIVAHQAFRRLARQQAIGV